MAKIKLNDNSECTVQVVVERFTDEFGRKFLKTKTFSVNKPIELGSIKEPKNQNILSIDMIAYPDIEPSRSPNFNDIFKGGFS
jgi:hypothetical protein